MDRAQVYKAIDTERGFQDRKWGTLKTRSHEVGAWILLMQKLLRDAEIAWSTGTEDFLALDEIRKVLAVGVACCEQHGVDERTGKPL